MPNYTSGSARVPVDPTSLTGSQTNGSVVLDSRRVRPYWFDGRFLDARDLEREQEYFLQREADLGQASGFQTVTGLTVDQTDSSGQFVGVGSFIIHAGEGITPAGEAVSVPSDLTVALASLGDQASLDAQFGLTSTPGPLPQKRTGLYVIGLQPMEYTANPITAYPTTVQGPRTTHDGDIVEATVVSLLPYPNPAASFAPSLQQAALARQIFVTGNPAVLPDSLLPLALVSVQQGAIAWIDAYLVRRDVGPAYSGVRFGLTDPAAQQAYLLQYDLQLQSIVAARQANGLKANFAASDFLQSIPSAGRFPMDAIDTGSFSQVFFPQEMDVRLSIIPCDELPALLDDSLSLPPIDLTLPSSAYSSMAVLALIPVPYTTFAALKSALPDTPLNPTLPQVLANRSPLQLLRLFQGAVNFVPVAAVANNAWATAIGSQQFGYYLRRPSDPTLVQFKAPTGVMLTSSPNPSVLGQTVTFTAGLSPVSATGSVQFMDGATSIGTATITSGVATFETAALAVGSHPITAVYAGDAGDAAGTSAVLTQIVNRVASSVALSSSVNPSTLGQAVTFTAKVTPTTATGKVQFMDGNAVLGTGTIAAGVASFATSSLAVGVHPITVAYSGDENNAPSTSTVLTQTVDKDAASVALGSSVNPSNVGQSVTFTAKVTPAAATGSTQFLDGTVVLGSGALSGGTATLAISTLAAGSHPITAVYSGDSSTSAATSAVLTQTVNKTASAVTLSSSENPSIVGQSVTFTAEVTPATATGSIRFLDGTTLLGSATLSAGTATLPVATLAVGSHPITAAYSGDTNNAAATSAVLAQTIDKVGSGVTLSSSLNPSTLGQSVTFTAKIAPATATGTVQFLDGTASLGTATLSGGAAALADVNLAVGSHPITAAYSGDGNDAAATSAVLTQTVDKAATSVALSSSVNPSTPSQSVTFTAKVTPASATGTVQFLDATASVGTATLSGGTATLAVSTLAVGSHPITAAYGGDASDIAATSAVLTQIVNKAGTEVTLTSSVNPSTPSQSVTFTAKITPATATGTVQFLEGTASLGTATLSGGAAALADANLAVGSHPITAAYSGDANDAAATSAVLTQIVNKTGTEVTLTSSVNPSTPGQSVTFTAKIAPATATGTVQFLEGTASLGTATLSGGTATLAVSTLAVGSHPITAVYGGDGNDAAATSAVLTQTVDKAATSVALSSSINPSTLGQSVTFMAKVTPSTATGTVQFLDGTASLGTATVSGGAATLAVTSLTAGSHAITAIYSGDADDAASTSAPLTQTVNKAGAKMALSSSPNPSALYAPVTFTATVTPNSATGTVTFQLKGAAATTTLGTAPLKTGQAQLIVSASTLGDPLPVGANVVTATYPGDANTNSATAQTTQTVNQQVIQ